MFLYALPVGLYLISSGVHNIVAHRDFKLNKGPQNHWWLEFVIPFGGEWIHKVHHQSPKLTNWNVNPKYLDLGGMLINHIRTK